MNFYGSGLEAGIALWLAASLSFVLVHVALWTNQRGWRPAVRYAIAAVLMSVPPFGIVGWAHPITAAGAIFPGWGWIGFTTTAIGLMIMTTRYWPVAVLTLGSLWSWSSATWEPPGAPDNWVGIDTEFRDVEGQYAGYDQQLSTIELVRSAAARQSKVVVLPESAIGTWTPTAERLWTNALTGLGVTVIAGAIDVGADGYDNVMLKLTPTAGQIFYRERMPVPVSMWQPWLSWTDQAGGARAHFFANPIVEINGLRVAPIICYEQLLVWPVVQSALAAPDIIVATGNGWWTQGTSIIAIQRASTLAWARLFSLGAVLSFNGSCPSCR